MLPDIYRPPTPPMPHQYEALEKGWDRTGFGYLLEMGLGKSRVTIDNFCMLYAKSEVDALLVIAPKSVYTNWTRIDDENPGEIQKWMWPEIYEHARIHTYRAGRLRQDAASMNAVLDRMNMGPRVLAINIEAISATEDAVDAAIRFLRAHRTMIVIDESTVIKNPTSVRTKKCLKLAPLAHYRRILTGSPSTGSTSDVFSQFEFLGPGEQLLGHRLFSTFRSAYSVLKEMNLPGRSRPVTVEVGPKNIEELANRMARHSIRKRKKDCLNLPDKVYMRREVELTTEQKRVYTELKKTAMAEIRQAIGSEGPVVVTTQIVITQLLRMHQVVCGHIKTDDGNIVNLDTNRVNVLMEILEESNEQAVIWVMYRPDADRVVSALRKKYGEDSVAEWHGGVTQAERERGEADFQAGRRRFMVSSSAGARGRTWTAAQLVVYYSNDHDLETRQQSEDRTHRIGTTGTVTYIDLVATETVDEKIIKALRSKKNIATLLLQERIEDWI